MINSLLIAILGYATLATVAILDKFILSKKMKHPAVYAFYSTIFSAIAFAFLPFLGLPNGLDIVWSALSGITFGLGIWTMFIAFRYGEASHLSPFLGSVIALVSLGLSFMIWGISFDLIQISGLILLIVACFLLSFEKSRAHNGFHRGFVWAIVSAILFSCSHVLAKYIYSHYSFFEGLVWTRGTISLVGLFILIFPRFNHQLFLRDQVKDKDNKSNGIIIVIANKVLGITATLLIQYAISLGHVAVINALAGIQYVLMFAFIYLLTKFFPRLFSEYFTRKEIVFQLVAILLILIGLALLI